MPRDEPVTRRTPTAAHWGAYEAEVRDGRLVGLRPFADDPDPSPIGAGIVDALRDDVRITAPMARAGWLERVRGGRDRGRRGADPFVRLGWDEALDLVAAEIDRVRDRHGNEAIYGGSYGWGSAGRFHHPQSQVHRFLNLAGGYTASVNTYSTAAIEVTVPHVIGQSSGSYMDDMPTWDEIAEHGQLVVAFGGIPRANSQVNTGGIARHRSAEGQRRCRQAGVRFVNVAPLRGDVGEDLGADWLPVRPGTDVAVMLGLAHTMVEEGLHDRDFLARCCSGWPELERYLRGEVDGRPKTAEWAAALADVPADALRRLARDMASSRTVVAMSWAVQRARYGEQPTWMAFVLAAMTGSMGRPGGGVALGYGSVHASGLAQRPFPVAALEQFANPVAGAVPVARIADLLLDPGGELDYDGRRLRLPDVRLVYWCGGNPFHHHQDLNRLDEAWQRPETVVVHEPWWNALARRADVVFPAATPLEREDLAIGRGEWTLLAMHRAVEPPPGVRTDHEVFAGLAGRLGFGHAFTEGRTARGWIEHLYRQTCRNAEVAGYEMPPFDRFWADGRVELPAPPGARAPAFADLRRDPEAFPLATPSGRIEIVSEVVRGFGYDDCPGHPTWMEPDEWLGAPGATAGHLLHLLSPQPGRKLHSQLDNGGYSRAGKVAGREAVLVSPVDAAARGICTGQVVRLTSPRGACLAGAVVSDAVRPGVVALATGAWYDPSDPTRPGSLERHGNPNVLTPDRGTSRLAQGPSPNTCLVTVEPVAADELDGSAAVGAFAPPRVLDEVPV
ncbi:MAG: molybdopterin-dependent oxidoreductase [Acidimicrobiia bacterium]